MAEIEARATELREKGLCRIKFNSYIVEYKKRNGTNVKIRMLLINILKPS